MQKKRSQKMFWITNATDFIDPVLESSYKVYQQNQKLKPFNSPYDFYGPLNFSTIFTFKVLWPLCDCCTMNRHLWRDIFTYIYICAGSFVLKYYVFVKLMLFFDLNKWAHSDKNDLIVWKYVQNKGNVGQDTVLDFADISS